MGLKIQSSSWSSLVAVYLHEEWDRCVLQRDNKASKIILDTNFNVKLCDFGLARLMDYDIGSHTTGLISQNFWLHMAPDRKSQQGNKSKESDIYSFGVGILKSHKKALRLRVLLKECGLGSVWKTTTFVSYGEIFGEEYNKEQADPILLLWGVWCSHPDGNSRPSIREATQVLNLESPLPYLPQKMPVPMNHISPTCFTVSSSRGLGSSYVLKLVTNSQYAATKSMIIPKTHLGVLIFFF